MADQLREVIRLEAELQNLNLEYSSLKSDWKIRESQYKLEIQSLKAESEQSHAELRLEEHRDAKEDFSELDAMIELAKKELMSLQIEEKPEPVKEQEIPDYSQIVSLEMLLEEKKKELTHDLKEIEDEIASLSVPSEKPDLLKEIDEQHARFNAELAAVSRNDWKPAMNQQIAASRRQAEELRAKIKRVHAEDAERMDSYRRTIKSLKDDIQQLMDEQNDAREMLRSANDMFMQERMRWREMQSQIDAYTLECRRLENENQYLIKHILSDRSSVK